jgi:Leucine-rich repeat (LRR) protein
MVEVEVEVDADAEQRRIVARCMHNVPDNMNIKEGYNLMNILYKFGILSDYLAALDNNNGFYEYRHGKEVEFRDFFDFDCWSRIKIDPKTGRITSLMLGNRYDKEDENHDQDYTPFDVPSIIEQFQSLETIDLNHCQLLIMELGNLPLLKTIGFFCCLRNMFENIPEGLKLPSIEKVVIDGGTSFFDSNLSLLLKMFSNNLKELIFIGLKREQKHEFFVCSAK